MDRKQKLFDTFNNKSFIFVLFIYFFHKYKRHFDVLSVNCVVVLSNETINRPGAETSPSAGDKRVQQHEDMLMQE